MFLKIVAFIPIILGFAMVLLAGFIVDRFNLDRDVKCDFDHGMNQEELKQYKRNRAVLNFKMLGMLVALPGLILIIILFR